MKVLAKAVAKTAVILPPLVDQFYTDGLRLVEVRAVSEDFVTVHDCADGDDDSVLTLRRKDVEKRWRRVVGD